MGGCPFRERDGEVSPGDKSLESLTGGRVRSRMSLSPLIFIVPRASKKIVKA
jgi:hypothetical protein